MSQNVTFLLQQVDHRQNTPINRPTAIVLQKPACKSRRGHLGACFNPLGSVPTAIYPLCCSAAARLHFLFPARSLAKFCYIDQFVSARAKNSFSPGATLHQHHDGGGKHLPSVEERQLHYFHHAELGHLCKKVRT
jgi:hypothetical protein